MAELEIERVGSHEFVGRNSRGATLCVGRAGAEGAFSPGELLQLATAACSAITAEELLVRRAGQDSGFTVTVGKDSRPGEFAYDALHVTINIALPGPDGADPDGTGSDGAGLDEAATARLHAAVRRAIERECTVSRTLERGAPVTLDFA
jgi:uncharacterized OsmC-like protein